MGKQAGDSARPEPAAGQSAYLDIETSYQGKMTVIGVHYPGRGTRQLVGEEITALNLLDLLQPAGVIKTYNGDRFDLPVIKQQLGLDLKKLWPHQDIMYRCWALNLKGGLKAVERQLGLQRETEGVDGLQAMSLWSEWLETGNRQALNLLLHYNREDVELLVLVEQRLRQREEG
jgi:uncharacterized protein YprB with RNaseH-like and TPR domain